MSFDWEQGAWRKDNAGTPDKHILVAADWAPIRELEELMLSDPEAVYGDLLPELRQGDLRIVNLECALVDDGTPLMKGGPNLRGSPRAVASLKAVPFDVACLANNHTFDYGPDALQQTRDLLTHAGIKTVGAGLAEDDACAPLVLSVGQARVGLVNFGEGEDCTSAKGGPGIFGWDVERVVGTVNALRPQTDLVLVIAHVGREHVPVPPPYVVEAFHRIADAGADAVIAHHPHVPQGIDIHGDVPLLYSLGNFVFYQGVDVFYRNAGYVLDLELSGKDLAGLRLMPYRIGLKGLEKMQGALRRWFFDRLRRVSEPLEDIAAVRAVWEAYLDTWGQEKWPANLEVTVKALREEPARGAAALRNVFITPAHRELWTDAMTRIIQGEMGTAPDWARALVEEWTTLTVEEGLRCPE